MGRFFVVATLAFLAISSVALAEPVLQYECSGYRSFQGTVPLVRDGRSRVSGVDATYFASAAHHADIQDPVRELVMVLIGRNRREPGVNRVCFAWAAALSSQADRAVSASISSDERCSGFTSKNGSLMTIVGNGQTGPLICDLKIQG